MVTKWMSFKNWSVTAKLVAVFVVFGSVPMGIVGWMGYSAVGQITDSIGANFKGLAGNIANKIDRNLSERYGDVQAFSLNRIIGERYNWYVSDSNNEISTTMNEYVKTYGIYYLTMLVDLEGDIIAVNFADSAGDPLDTAYLYTKNFKEAPWFQALLAEQYTTKMAFTAEGNDASTGTYVEDLHIDEDVKTVYPGDPGLTIGFSAPFYMNGELMGFWTNRAKFSLVEGIVQDAYRELKASGLPTSEITLMDGEGRVIVDYDPASVGAEEMNHDFENTLFKMNLAEQGLDIAQKAVAGESGYQLAYHPSKEIWQLAGYNHLTGANGFPGMNWSVLVRAPQDEAAVAAIAFQRNLMMAALMCMGAILALGLWIGRSSARALIQVNDVAQLAAMGDMTQRIPVTSHDELGKMSEALNTMFENVAQVVGEVRQAADQVATAAGEISQGNDDLSQRTSDQASSLEETSASMEEMTSIVKQNADNSKQANQLAIAAREVAEKGGKITADAVQAMDGINKSSKKIADIINVIDEIAFQTNLLALNAAVEAARAGEQGRGFAVVATEVRNLAQRSAGAAKEIKQLINESVQKVGDGSELVNQSGKTLDEIVGSVKRVTDIISEISAASQEQSSGIDQVNKAIMQMDQTTQQNAALVEQAASSAQSMQQQAASLQREVDFFKTSDSGDTEAPPSRRNDATSSPSKAATPAAKKSSAPPAPAQKETRAPAGVGAGNGPERRPRQDDDFEEF